MNSPQQKVKTRNGRFYWNWKDYLPLALIALWSGYIIWSMGFHQPNVPVAFDDILGQPRPSGISELSAVQRQMFIKQWAWLRFRASDAAMTSLLREAKRVEDAELIGMILEGTRGVPSDKYKTRDKDAVGWDEVISIKRPEYYRMTSFSLTNGWGWIAELIVDRENQLVYVHACSD